MTYGGVAGLGAGSVHVCETGGHARSGIYEASCCGSWLIVCRTEGVVHCPSQFNGNSRSKLDGGKALMKNDPGLPELKQSPFFPTSGPSYLACSSLQRWR